MTSDTETPVLNTHSRRHVLGVGALSLAAFGLAGSAARAAELSWSATETKAKALIDGKIVPGLSLCVVKRGKTLYAKGFGFANLETRTAMTPRHVLRVGSISKQFTAAALVLLAQDGKLAFDDKLSKYLPEVPHGDEITIRQMLNHTSGLGNYTNRANPHEFLMIARVDYAPADLLKLMIDQPGGVLAHEPGTKWAYSNTAYVLLGLIIERLTGGSYGTFIQEHLLQPHGLSHTAVDDAAEIVPDRVNGYDPNPNAPSKFANTSFISMTVPGGAGAMRSTPEDLCHWHQALLSGRVVPADGLTEMLKPGLLKDGTIPNVSAPGSTGPAAPLKYGFGLMLDSPTYAKFGQNKHSVRHGGGINGFLSDLVSFPEQGLSVAMVTNVTPSPDTARQVEAVVGSLIETAIAA